MPTPYGTEYSFNGLRLAHTLAKNDTEFRGKSAAAAGIGIDSAGEIARQKRDR